MAPVFIWGVCLYKTPLGRTEARKDNWGCELNSLGKLEKICDDSYIAEQILRHFTQGTCLRECRTTAYRHVMLVTILQLVTSDGEIGPESAELRSCCSSSHAQPGISDLFCIAFRSRMVFITWSWQSKPYTGYNEQTLRPVCLPVWLDSVNITSAALAHEYTYFRQWFIFVHCPCY